MFLSCLVDFYQKTMMCNEKGIFGTLYIYFQTIFFLLFNYVVFNFVVPLCHLEDIIFYYQQIVPEN